MHHGYYPVGAPAPRSMDEHRAAQVDMIDKVLDWASPPTGESLEANWQPKSILDVGCGIGGSTRHIARRFAGSADQGIGITLSSFQRERAEALTAEAGLSDKLSFRVQNALQMPEEWKNKFDLVWSLESGEHMPDKPGFVRELCRVAAPGGRIIIVTWCHRDLEPLNPKEERLLARINRAYYLPRWCSTGDYIRLLEAEGCVNVRRADWTREIAAFWPAVIKSSLSPRGLLGLARSGFTTIRGAVAMLLMVKGYRSGLIVFGLITAEKAA